MKLILAGATGQIGRILLRDFARDNHITSSHDIVLLTRSTAPATLPPETRPSLQPRRPFPS